MTTYKPNPLHSILLGLLGGVPKGALRAAQEQIAEMEKREEGFAQDFGIFAGAVVQPSPFPHPQAHMHPQAYTQAAAYDFPPVGRPDEQDPS